MSVNIYDVAKKAGVSVVTVSRVLNNSPKVREKNRKKVMDAIKELDYKPNAAARSLAKGRTGMIGLVLPTINDPFMSQVVSSVEKNLRDRGMYLVVSFASEDIGYSNSIKLFKEERVDGILILSPLKDEQFIIELKRKNFPFVLLDQHSTNIQIPSITVDNFYGGYSATINLIKSGSKRIGHITGAEIYQSSTQRLNGYKKALLNNNMDIDSRFIKKGNFSAESGYKAMKEWIKSGLIPDAVFAADDNTAFGVIDAAREFKISIPEELSLIGFDDHPFSSVLHPKLSTVKQPTEELSKYGVELLLNIIKGKVKRVTTINLKPEVVLRETTKK